MISVLGSEGVEWEITSDKWQWILNRKSPSEKTPGKLSSHKSYHGTLNQAIRYMVDQSIKDLPNTEGADQMIEDIINNLHLEIKRDGKHERSN